MRITSSFNISLLCIFTVSLLSWTNLPYSPDHGDWKCGKVLNDRDVRIAGEETFFSIDTISDSVFKRMRKGGSYPDNCQVRRNDLRYLRLLHRNYNGETVCGELVCNKAIAKDLYEIFLELFRQKYPIERMVLIDNYGADDEVSMSHNNTSCFCYRVVNGTNQLSKHAKGLAVDINTLHNPCVKLDKNGRIIKIQPNTEIARNYSKRIPHKPHQIDKNDLCYKLFIQHGFKWGGSWRTVKDYQHFEK